MTDVWGAGTYERMAQVLVPAQDDLIAKLEPRPGERWLDLATGHGAIAIRAAQASFSQSSDAWCTVWNSSSSRWARSSGRFWSESSSSVRR